MTIPWEVDQVLPIQILRISWVFWTETVVSCSKLNTEAILCVELDLWQRYVYTKTLAMTYPLAWIRKRIQCGYVSKRNDWMTELRIQRFSQVRESLEMLFPYLRFKKKQAKLLIQACSMFERETLHSMSKKDVRIVVNLLVLIQNENYNSKTRKTKKELYKLFGLTP